MLGEFQGVTSKGKGRIYIYIHYISPVFLCGIGEPIHTLILLPSSLDVGSLHGAPMGPG